MAGGAITGGIISALGSILGGFGGKPDKPKLRPVPLTPQEQKYIDIFTRFLGQGSPGTNFVGDVARENVMQNPSPQFNFSPTGVSGRNPGTQFYKPPQGVDWASLIQKWREQFSRMGQQQAPPIGGGGGGMPGGGGRPSMAPRY